MKPKKIIITGGATRIGAAIAQSLASYDTKISIHYNKSKSAASKLKNKLEKLGSKIYLLKADLNNFNQTQSLLKVAYKKMKGVDCLINNASIFENDNLQNFSEKSFTKHVNINLKAPAILIPLPSVTFCLALSFAFIGALLCTFLGLAQLGTEHDDRKIHKVLVPDYKPSSTSQIKAALFEERFYEFLLYMVRGMPPTGGGNH